MSWKKVINNILAEETLFVNDLLSKKEKIYVDDDTDVRYQKLEKMTRLEKIIRVMVKLAEAGDLEAVRFLADYTVGRPRQHVDISQVEENPYDGMNELELRQEMERLECGATLRIAQGTDSISKE